MKQSKMYLIDMDPFEIFMWGADYGQLLSVSVARMKIIMNYWG